MKFEAIRERIMFWYQLMRIQTVGVECLAQEYPGNYFAGLCFLLISLHYEETRDVQRPLLISLLLLPGWYFLRGLSPVQPC